MQAERSARRPGMSATRVQWSQVSRRGIVNNFAIVAVCLVFVLSVRRISHKRVYGGRPNMVGIGKR